MDDFEKEKAQKAVSEAIKKQKETYQRNKLLKAAPESEFHAVENLPQEPTDTQKIREELLEAKVPAPEIVRMTEPQLRKRWRQVAGVEPIEGETEKPKVNIQPSDAEAQEKADAFKKLYLQGKSPEEIQAILEKGAPKEPETPTFKNSNDAVAFGRKNPKNQEVRSALDTKRKELLDEHKRLLSEGNNDEARKAGQQAAFIREAIEHIDEPSLKTPVEKLQEREKEKPKIVSAVVKVNGKQYEGASHEEALNKAGLSKNNTTEGKDWTPYFKTDDGRLITREQAKEEFGITHSEEVPELKAKQDAVAVQSPAPFKEGEQAGKVNAPAPTSGEGAKPIEPLKPKGTPTKFVSAPNRDGTFPVANALDRFDPNRSAFGLSPIGNNRFEVDFVGDGEKRAWGLPDTFLKPLYEGDGHKEGATLRKRPVVEKQADGSFKVIDKGLYATNQYVNALNKLTQPSPSPSPLSTGKESAKPSPTAGEGEPPGVAPDALLSEEHGPAAVELDRDLRSRSSAARRRAGRADAPDPVEPALEERRGAGQVKAPYAHHGHAVEVVELDRGADDLEQPGDGR